jgi:hypothetical protein
MKDNKITFSKLPYLAGRLCMTPSEAHTCAGEYCREFRNADVRKFTRTVKAGGASFAAYVVVARRKA